MKNKKKLIIVSLLLVIVFSFSLLSSVANTYIPRICTEDMESVINTFSNSGTEYKIEKIKYLKSVSKNTGYEYVLCDLSPSGYAVLTMDSVPLQVCYKESATPPIPMSDGNIYYYTCPGFVVEKDGILIDCETSNELSQEDISAISIIEQRISAARNIGSSNQDVRLTTTTEVYQIPYANYFDNLIDYGTNSTGNSCIAVAAGMIFGYYDFYINSNYVASQYSQAAIGHSTGTNEAFHTLLCQYIWGNSQITPKSLSDACPRLTAYIRERGFSFSFDVTPIPSNMTYLISTNRPAIGSLFRSDQEDGHAVVAYRCTINGSTTMYSVHMGYVDKDHPQNWVEFNQSLFIDAGYIYDCMWSSDHTYAYRYTFDNYHSGNYHYYEKEKYCTMCPVDCNEFIWESLRCNNCIEIMGTGIELEQQ